MGHNNSRSLLVFVSPSDLSAPYNLLVQKVLSTTDRLLQLFTKFWKLLGVMALSAPAIDLSSKTKNENNSISNIKIVRFECFLFIITPPQSNL
jgi:hypothetical protein